MSTIAVLTIKRFGAAKQRLGSASFRPALARAMMIDALASLEACDALDDVVIVSGEPQARNHRNVVDDPDEGHNPAAVRGIAAALDRGATRVLLAAGDCPLLDSTELAVLIAQDGEGVTVIADRHGTGTNGLIMSPPTLIAPSFGDGSCARHQALAAAAGADCSVASGTSLALDIDTPEDLRMLIEVIDANVAPSTHALLSAEGLL
jgi:2-phospho-L-lactate guanylyltransferase